ncbi:hypothetical protein CPAST_c30650 [Clostridium pasteurianum DSM 525 = ATCC 6013]|uniref:AAA domain-containing protein n=1 Tax=Clostridium pasteurianum DSM 525 = ATCC 6013 TaxID=1262449 RepID=A0A0H3J5A3_CLOPA|nr:hypothetical protein [Clostridium pasteurianum]AJA49131.1 hypothetical protein CPAST_c30650 [Clostridium pasteurianum DSM 525 = ATCC 6013]AJA53119.1 hypothetical protein CLPA_c30650 [Clostridium pasteurianum DSM 525 = ATCC 6013]ELP59066.1 hypothetical protein F502_11281 [Clostridium pasteurianum DSM 525 = ATCC 6013]KRU10873.1 hypothetical protein CP6013_00120 [Clostridium pasteurianum DSM 525 = ATCC 6013]UZW13437.1 hypothetical protein OSC52_16555 [Clostridium pasteurianum]
MIKVTASLALACCKNVVIVGDVKQLSQIVSSNIKKISDNIFYESNIGEAYNYNKYSIIASLMNLYHKVYRKVKIKCLTLRVELPPIVAFLA